MKWATSNHKISVGLATVDFFFAYARKNRSSDKCEMMNATLAFWYRLSLSRTGSFAFPGLRSLIVTVLNCSLIALLNYSKLTARTSAKNVATAVKFCLLSWWRWNAHLWGTDLLRSGLEAVILLQGSHWIPSLTGNESALSKRLFNSLPHISVIRLVCFVVEWSAFLLLITTIS